MLIPERGWSKERYFYTLIASTIWMIFPGGASLVSLQNRAARKHISRPCIATFEAGVNVDKLPPFMRNIWTRWCPPLPFFTMYNGWELFLGIASTPYFMYPLSH